MATITLYFLMVSYIIFIATCFILTSSGKKEELVECYSYSNGKIEYEGLFSMDEAIEKGYMMTSEKF